MKNRILKTLGAVLLFCFNINAFATNKALLIGVSNYQNKADQLEGPEHDVSAIKNTLQKYWGFQSKNIQTLLNNDATRSNILNSLAKLKDNTQASDHIFIYFSGHGTSEHDKNLAIPLPYNNSGALVPYGYHKNGRGVKSLVIGKRDLRPILLEMDKKGANIFIAFDSCYSGSTNRGSFGSFPSRTLAQTISPEFDVNSFDDEDIASYDDGKKNIESYPYNNIVYFSASSPREQAIDLPSSILSKMPTLDNKPHGAFTDTLLRAMSGHLNIDQNKDGKTNYSELLAAIKDFMKMRAYPHEPYISPSMSEDPGSLSLRNVLGRQSTLSNLTTSSTTALLTVSFNPEDPILSSKIKQLPGFKISSWPADLNLKKQGDNYRLFNKTGDLITSFSLASNKKIIDRVKQEAWKKHFKQKLQQRASINMEMVVKNGISGSTVKLGDTLSFSLRSEKNIYLLLININSKGIFELLYPSRPREMEEIPAQQVKVIPSKNIKDWIDVEEPVGLDHLIAIGFSEKPPFLHEFLGRNNLPSESDDLYKKLKVHLDSEKFGYSELDLLVVSKNKGES